MEKSWIEKLSDYAEKNSYEYWSNSESSSAGFVRNIITTIKYFVMEIKTEKHTYYFCASMSRSGNISTNGSYSGLFRVFSNSAFSTLNIRRRFFIDKLTFGNNNVKTGNPTFDKKLLVQCANKELVSHIANSRVGSAFIKMNKTIPPLEIIVEKNRMNFNRHFDKKSILGLKTNRWVTNEKELNQLIEGGINLLNNITNKR